MKISHIEHLGIAVTSIEEALPYYENVLGLKCYNIETVEDQKVKTAFLKVGEVKIELLEPTSPESTIAKFIEKNGGIRRREGCPPHRQGSPQRCRRAEHCLPAPEIHFRCIDGTLREARMRFTRKHKLTSILKKNRK